ncbi:uncharacterized protein LOC109898140 [Oncorhynchus kisutch]|uniref:uncharacterized protein LOC109898140 n=1 Tax=Oncorhynchus kisutch TaxID=8019 RepID=UPI00099FE1FB|nr:uncharacterized protein LOC109898140 [Oncorhynchus kisutch]XP_031689527.1 uncharacterized protein LOC109898140 [Oncorhynchus kisutch]XP_031689528.1 uncharacterized protein LOC109898140 [Oncorhynchus kisutch]
MVVTVLVTFAGCHSCLTPARPCTASFLWSGASSRIKWPTHGCSLNGLIKIKTILSTDTQLYLGLATTLLAILPMSIKLLVNPTLWQFKLPLYAAIVTERWSVGAVRGHLPGLPVRQRIPAFPPLEHCSEDELRLGPYHRPIRMPSMDLGRVTKWKFYISIVAMAGLCFMSMTLAPLARLPDLFPLLVSVFFSTTSWASSSTSTMSRLPSRLHLGVRIRVVATR